MHEFSVATEVCRMVEERLGPDVATLVEIGLEVGTDSGLEPENLQFCLETLLAQPPFTGATTVIERPRGDVLRLSYMEIDDGSPEN
jgi:Zn finger protein HypA/HybF involved in hydrogenase expression